MARTIQGIITKHNLMKQPMVVINKAGGAGGEGFLDVKNSKNNPHKIVITLSNLFTTPLATGIPFNWKDLTPVAMLALDEFVLWVNAEKPYKNAKDGRHRLKAGRPDHHRSHAEGHWRQVHLHSAARGWRGRGAIGRQPRRFHRQQSERGHRSLARGQVAAALRVR
jgi:tripartite-type tricarboxylate transporter receptor subunit TctC